MLSLWRSPVIRDFVILFLYMYVCTCICVDVEKSWQTPTQEHQTSDAPHNIFFFSVTYASMAMAYIAPS